MSGASATSCTGALQYVPELTWILFLRILDDSKTQETERSEAVGAAFTPSLEAPLPLAGLGRNGRPKRIAPQNEALGKAFSGKNTAPLCRICMWNR